jgi:hypothetical protein
MSIVSNELMCLSEKLLLYLWCVTLSHELTLEAFKTKSFSATCRPKEDKPNRQFKTLLNEKVRDLCRSQPGPLFFFF